MPTSREIAAGKEQAKQHYDKLLEVYELHMANEVSVPKGVIKAYKAQMSVFAGIYNRDYAQYKRGVDRYAKYGNPDRYAANSYLFSSGHDRDSEVSTNTSLAKTLYDDNLALYKSLYNKLPRGYFRS